MMHICIGNLPIIGSDNGLVALLAPSHYLSQCWNIVNLNLRNKLHWNFNRNHDDVIKWKHFPRNWPFVWGIRRSPVNSPPKGQWYGALMFSLICAWINAWVNNCEAGDLRHHHAHYHVIVMFLSSVMVTLNQLCFIGWGITQNPNA